MAFISIDVDGMAVRAQLNEEGAPGTCKAVWEALPFEGRAVHAQISGDMFRMLEPAPVAEGLPVESSVYSQHPGSVIFYPPIREIAFCVGRAQFSAPQGQYALTPLAEIEAGSGEWMQLTNNLIASGTRPIRFSRAADQDTPFRHPAPGGPEIEITFAGATVRASVLADDLSPAAVREVLTALPLSGQGVNHTWAGPMTVINADRAPSLRRLEDSAGTTFHWPGYLYYDPAAGTFTLCYGDATANIQGVPQPLIPVAQVTQDLSPYIAVARSQLLDGAKPISIRAL